MCEGMANPHRPDADLNFLIDSFPSVSLELIASFYTKARGDAFLATELISRLSLSEHPSPSPGPGSIRKPRDSTGIRENSHSGNDTYLSDAIDELSQGSKSYSDDFSASHHDRQFCRKSKVACESSVHGEDSKCLAPGSKVKIAHSGDASSTSIVSARPGPATLEEYFPVSPPKNPWSDCSMHPLDRSASFQRRSNMNGSNAFGEEYPPLGQPETRQKVLPQPVQAGSRGPKGASVACGLVPNARRQRSTDQLLKASYSKDSVRENSWNNCDMSCGENTLWPTEAEAFLLSNLGDEVELGVEAVRDILSHYKGDMEKALEVLLQMKSTSSCETVADSKKENPVQMDACITNQLNSDQEKDMQAQHIYQERVNEMLQQDNSSMKWAIDRLQDQFPSLDSFTLLEALKATEFNCSDAEKMLREADMDHCLDHESKPEAYELPSRILESLFFRECKDKVEEAQEHGQKRQSKSQKASKTSVLKKPSTVVEKPEWKVVTSSDFSDSEETTVLPSFWGGVDDYKQHHQSAKTHWETMRAYLKVAAEAYDSGDFKKADELNEKANVCKELATEARTRANSYLSETRNNQHGSEFTLDLQDQHSSGALKLLRYHLKTFSRTTSFNTLRVIIGSVKCLESRHIKMRDAVIDYLEDKSIKWTEMAPFNIQVQIGQSWI